MVALGPSISSAANWMTKEGAIVAQSFVAGCGSERRGQNGSQDQAGELKGSVRLRPDREPGDESRPDCYRGSRNDPRAKSGAHSGDFHAEFERAGHARVTEQCPDHFWLTAQPAAGGTG